MHRVALAALFGLVASHAAATCPAPEPLCQAYWRYEAVFDGTVTAIDRLDLEDDMSGTRRIVGHRLVTFEVHKAWKGVEGTRVQLFLWGGYGVVMSESFHVAIGGRYVIFANRAPNGYLTTGGCSPSQEFVRAGPVVLEFLSALERPPTGGRVFGTTMLVSEFSRNPLGGYLPVETEVVLSGQGLTRTPLSRYGSYEFSQLPPGEFAVRVTVPTGFAIGSAESLVQLSDLRACGSAAFPFRYDTRVAGLVTARDGRPLKGVPVDLVEAASWNDDHPRGMMARTDDAGFYELAGASPGRYVVGVNVADAVDGVRPYPRVLYPGSGETPLVLQVQTSAPLLLAPMQIDGPLAQLQLDLLVIREEGSVAANTRVELEDVTENPPSDTLRRWRVGFTDGKGRVRLDGWGGRRYVVSVWDYSGDKPTRLATSRPFTAAVSGSVRILLPRPQ